MHFLAKLEVEEFEDIKSGYRIHFHFDENPYFENATLTKEFCLGAVSGPSSNSTPITWKEGKDLLKLMQFKQQSTKRKRHIEYKTFFDWFIDNSDPVNDEIAEVRRELFLRNVLDVTTLPGFMTTVSRSLRHVDYWYTHKVIAINSP